MTSGFGVDPTLDANGAVISGTTATDLQNIWGGLYTPGVVSGCAVSTGATMNYTVAAGVVMIPTATGKIIPAPVPASTVLTTAPATGSRTDIIYAQQRFPNIEGDSECQVFVGETLPARSVQLDKRTVNAGITSTNATTRTASVDYSIPYGGSLGILYQWTDTYSGVHGQDDYRCGNGTITVPTDRLLRISISSMLWATNAVGFDNANYCEWYFRPEIDNVEQAYWATPGLHQAWAIYMFEGYFQVPAGTHTVSYRRGRRSGPGTASTKYGTVNGDFFPGTVFTVEDAGVIK